FHGIPTSYYQFSKFLQEQDHDVYDNVEKYLMSGENLWSCFEENLASLDTDMLLEEASEFLVGYGAEDWSDAYHHDYQYEIEQVVNSLSKKLRTGFTEWIKQL